MLVTAFSPVIGYDKASKIAPYVLDNDLTQGRRCSNANLLWSMSSIASWS